MNANILKKENELFDIIANDYDLYRPSYPNDIIEKIIVYFGSSKIKALEIGSGSGKATSQFLDYNIDITCLDPGEKLIDIGKSKYKDYSNIRFCQGSFEEYSLDEEKFDLIFSAQAFHWIKQPIGYQKCFDILNNNGILALFWNMYILNNNKSDIELLNLSNKYGGFEDFVNVDNTNNRINSIISGINSSKLFNVYETKFVKWEKEYTIDEYFKFLNTGNTLIKMTDEEKKNVYKDLIIYGTKNNNRITRTYICALYLCKKTN